MSDENTGATDGYRPRCRNLCCKSMQVYGENFEKDPSYIPGFTDFWCVLTSKGQGPDGDRPRVKIFNWQVGYRAGTSTSARRRSRCIWAISPSTLVRACVLGGSSPSIGTVRLPISPLFDHGITQAISGACRNAESRRSIQSPQTSVSAFSSKKYCGGSADCGLRLK